MAKQACRILRTSDLTYENLETLDHRRQLHAERLLADGGIGDGGAENLPRPLIQLWEGPTACCLPTGSRQRHASTMPV